MIKIKVLSLRSIFLKSIILIIFSVIIGLCVATFKYLYHLNSINVEKKIIDSVMMAQSKEETETSNIKFLKSELRVLGTVDVDDEAEKNEETLQDSDEMVSSSIQELYVQKISDSKYKVGSVYINSYLKRDVELEELSKPLDVKVNNPCNILIYHTHTSESYSLDDSDYYRTEDDKYNVVAVGEKLAENLKKYGFMVTHDRTKHDSPSYNGAYKASLATVEKCLKEKDYDIILDIHRDALSGNSKFRPTAEINGETAAKIMIVVGTDDAGLEHNNWMQNFKFAIALQEKANELYPGLFRDMHLSTSRYNQHTSDKTLIIEVGATGNTMQETEIAMKYFAKILSEVVQK